MHCETQGIEDGLMLESLRRQAGQGPSRRAAAPAPGRRGVGCPAAAGNHRSLSDPAGNLHGQASRAHACSHSPPTVHCHCPHRVQQQAGLCMLLRRCWAGAWPLGGWTAHHQGSHADALLSFPQAALQRQCSLAESRWRCSAWLNSDMKMRICAGEHTLAWADLQCLPSVALQACHQPGQQRAVWSGCATELRSQA